MWREGTVLIPEVCTYVGRGVAIPGRPSSDLARSPLICRANLHWKHRVQGRAIMFGEGFEDCWYKVPGAPGLELSGDLRFRGPQGLRKLRVRLQRAAVRHGQEGRWSRVRRSGTGRAG